MEKVKPYFLQINNVVYRKSKEPTTTTANLLEQQLSSQKIQDHCAKNQLYLETLAMSRLKMKLRK